MIVNKILESLGIEKVNKGGFCGEWLGSGKITSIISPINGEELAQVTNITKDQYETIIHKAHDAFSFWKQVPAPKRGEVVRSIADELRANKEALGQLVTC